MKKLIAMLLALVMVFAFAACAKDNDNNDGTGSSDKGNETTVATQGNNETPNQDSAVMDHNMYIAAEMDAKVTVETYVQATQSWWDNKITAYCQSKDGAYFAYELASTQEDAAKLVPGTKIKITGTKGQWSGEVEIMDGTFEFVENGDTYIAEALDATALLGTDALIDHQNEKVIFKGMTVTASKDANDNEAAFLYNWDGSGSADSDSDLYFNASVNGATYTFCVEYYLCGPDSDAYKAVQALKIGDVIDIEGFLYWYEGAQPHVTAITVK